MDVGLKVWPVNKFVLMKEVKEGNKIKPVDQTSGNPKILRVKIVCACFGITCGLETGS